MKRMVVAAVLAISLAAGVTLAEAAVETGSYKGSIDKGGKIKVKISKVSGKKRVVKVSWSAFPTFACPDDGDGNPNDDQTAEGAGEEGSVSNLTVKINDEGKFTVKLVNGTGSIRVTIKGKANGNKVTGTFREVQRYTNSPDGDELSGEGTTVCDSGKRKYTATK